MTRLLTVNQAAEVLQLDPSTVRRFLREGQLSGVKLGSRWRLPSDVAVVPPREPAARERREPKGRMARVVREIEEAGPGPYGPWPIKPPPREIEETA